MYIIQHIYSKLSNIIRNRIRLYNDDYNENCFGDHFQKKCSSTILFESGFFENDYKREVTRKYMFLSIAIALELISNNIINDNVNVDKYEHIPKNAVRFYDIILRKVPINNSSLNIGINYREILNDKTISFVPYVESVGDLDNLKGHKEVVFPSHYFKDLNTNTFTLGSKMNESLIKSLNL